MLYVPHRDACRRHSLDDSPHPNWLDSGADHSLPPSAGQWHQASGSLQICSHACLQSKALIGTHHTSQTCRCTLVLTSGQTLSVRPARILQGGPQGCS